ncbi:phosphohistidine phosphatase SixA [Methylonatrum kenyense]|uniref:phosphohistidine phosphatase SixA n=1 Tax=Methylonatrum kenyense TaxID=455253 RepID=UPI0020BF418E|nr:phosphohistidine phosphatase SixA [Methylonatrum kenyense]MCK8515701.1 phosphohistidine phosphatase SixA [Methylonatrum kenyense]
MQRIVLFRHGPAEEPSDELADMARALTDKGRKKTEKAARGLSTLLGSVDLLLSSPLLRAVQTADIVDEHLHVPRREETALLEPAADPQGLIDWLAEDGSELAVLIGHEPHLNHLAGLSLTGNPDGFLVFRKAGAGMIEFPDRAASGRAELRWLLSPSHLTRKPAT